MVPERLAPGTVRRRAGDCAYQGQAKPCKVTHSGTDNGASNSMDALPFCIFLHMDDH